MTSQPFEFHMFLILKHFKIPWFQARLFPLFFSKRVKNSRLFFSSLSRRQRSNGSQNERVGKAAASTKEGRQMHAHGLQHGHKGPWEWVEVC